MENPALTLLKLAFAGYVAGAVAGLLLLRFQRLANILAFGFGSLAALSGLVSSILSLATPAGSTSAIPTTIRHGWRCIAPT